MSSRTCVYTCITGNYDNLKEFIKEPGVDYICFTNNPNLKSDYWKIIFIENEGLDDIRLARKIKIIGHKYLDTNYDESIWIDGATRIIGSIKEFIDKECKKEDYPLSVFKHSQRNNVYDEAVACVYNRRARHESVKEEIEFIKENGFQDDNGLVESTVFYKKHNLPIVKKTMEYWFDLITRFTTRDQLGFNYAIYKSGINVNWINKNVFFNEYFSWENHLSRKSFSNVRVYYGEFNNLDCYNYEDLYLENKEDIYKLNISIKHCCDKVYIHLGQMPLYRFKVLDSNVKDSLSFNCLNTIGDYLVLDNNVLIIKIDQSFKVNDQIRFEFKLEELSKQDILDVFRQVHYDKQYQKGLFDDAMKDNNLKQEYIVALEGLVKELEEIKSTVIWKVWNKLKGSKK